MTDTTENSSVTVEGHQETEEPKRHETEEATVEGEGEGESKLPAMAETEEQPPVSKAAPEKTSVVSFSIWPPTQRTRDAVTNRLVETLSTPSILSKRYGTMSPGEAADAARRIEEEAFVAAGGSATSDDDGIEILQVYSKEISKRMLDAVKSRSAAGVAEANAAPSGGEEVPSVESAA